jgi:hypothetical protein
MQIYGQHTSSPNTLKAENLVQSLLIPLHTCGSINFIEGNTMLEEERVTTQWLVDVIRTMKQVESTSTEDDSTDFTEGYIQALDDLLAWLGNELQGK